MVLDDNNSDEKIFGLVQQALNPNLNILDKIRFCIYVLKSLKAEHKNKLSFNVDKTITYLFDSRVGDFKRLVLLREAVINSSEGFQYFDLIIDESDSKNVYNYNEVLENRIDELDDFIDKCLSEVVGVIDVSFNLEELLQK